MITKTPLDTPGYLCHWHISPQLIQGYLIKFFQWKFSRLENIQEPALRKSTYLWRPDSYSDETQTKGILIASAYDYDPTDAQQRPAIIIARGTTTLGEKLSIGDHYHTPGNLLGNGHDPNVTPTLGQNQQSIQIIGEHTIMAIHGSGGATEVLGQELWHTAIDHMHIIRKDLNLKGIRVGALNTLGKLKEYKDTWVAPFVVTYTYQRETLIRTETPLLKSFELTSELPGA